MTGSQDVIIVAAHRSALYEDLVKAFDGNARVRVIMDRRLEERRRHGASTPGPADRRGSDRRSRRDVEISLRSGGWALVSGPTATC